MEPVDVETVFDCEVSDTVTVTDDGIEFVLITEPDKVKLGDFWKGYYKSKEKVGEPVARFLAKCPHCNVAPFQGRQTTMNKHRIEKCTARNKWLDNALVQVRRAPKRPLPENQTTIHQFAQSAKRYDQKEQDDLFIRALADSSVPFRVAMRPS